MRAVVSPMLIRILRLLVGAGILHILWFSNGPVLASTTILTLQDDRGTSIVLERLPRRIVSLLPSLTETVCILGGCEKLVGIDRYSNWPTSIHNLPRMGGGIDPNIEAIVAARPDVVLLAGSTRGAERLEALGLKVIRLEPRTIADVRRVMEILVPLLGKSPSEGLRLWQEIELARAAAVDLSPKSMRGQRIYFEVNSAPYGAGPASVIGETLHLMGLINIIPANMGPFPKINPEFVVRAQPDIIMLSDSSRQSLMQRPGWKGLPAIQQHRLCVFNQAESDVLVRAGPRLAEAAQLIASCLQRLSRESP